MESNSLNKCLKIPKLALKCCGLNLDYPNKKTIKDYIKNSWLYIFNLLWLNTDFAGETYWFIQGVMEGKSFVELTFIAPCLFFTAMGMVKITQLFLNRNKIIKFIDDLRNIHPKHTVEDNENDKKIEEIATEEMNFLNFTVKTLFCLNAALDTFFLLSPFILMAYGYLKYGSTKLILPFLVKYPVDSNDIRFWPIIYFHQLWSAVVTTLYGIGSDSLLFVCCSCLRMHFKIIAHRIQCLITQSLKNVTPNDSKWYIKYDNDLSTSFCKIIKDHQKLITLVESLESLYSKSVFFNFISSSFLICLTGFNVATLDDIYLVMNFMIFLLTSLSQIFLLCFFGDMVIRSSAAVCDGVYHCKWFLVSNDLQKQLLFMMTRAQKPCKLTAIKYTNIDLKAFTKVLSTSWSYFALLRTVYNPNHH